MIIYLFALFAGSVILSFGATFTILQFFQALHRDVAFSFINIFIKRKCYGAARIKETLRSEVGSFRLHLYILERRCSRNDR